MLACSFKGTRARRARLSRAPPQDLRNSVLRDGAQPHPLYFGDASRTTDFILARFGFFSREKFYV